MLIFKNAFARKLLVIGLIATVLLLLFFLLGGTRDERAEDIKTRFLDAINSKDIGTANNLFVEGYKGQLNGDDVFSMIGENNCTEFDDFRQRNSSSVDRYKYDERVLYTIEGYLKCEETELKLRVMTNNDDEIINLEILD